MDGNEVGARDSIDINSLVATPTNVVYANTEQEVLVITKDKLHLCLQQASRRMAERDRWLVPLGVLVPLVLTIATSGFTKRFGIGGDEWETVFVMLTIFTAVWLVYSLFRRGKALTVDQIVEELAKNPVVISKPRRFSEDTRNAGVSSSKYQEIPEKPSSGSVSQDSTRDTDGGLPRDAMVHTGVRTRSVPTLSPGDIVTHDKFGLGTVVSVEGYGDQAEAHIDFGKRYGVKHLVLRYSPLAKI